MTKPLLESFNEVKSLGRPICPILNKIDLIEQNERKVVLKKAAETLSIPSDRLIPISAKTGENVEAVERWILETLRTSGKDLLFAKVVREKDAVVDKWILSSAAIAAAIGALPIPGSDIVPLTALQIGLILKIANAYGYEITREKAKSLLAATVTGLVGRTIFRTIVKAIGTVAGVGVVIMSAVAAVIAGSMTYGLGKAVQYYYTREEWIYPSNLFLKYTKNSRRKGKKSTERNERNKKDETDES